MTMLNLFLLDDCNGFLCSLLLSYVSSSNLNAIMPSKKFFKTKIQSRHCSDQRTSVVQSAHRQSRLLCIVFRGPCQYLPEYGFHLVWQEMSNSFLLSNIV